MRKDSFQEGTGVFCEKCDAVTQYIEVEMEPICPECGEKIVVCNTCSQGFFCERCNAIKSSKKVLWKEK
jgi:DNA-directed RNA polymerase subunit RPC12/RpoP